MTPLVKVKKKLCLYHVGNFFFAWCLPRDTKRRKWLWGKWRWWREVNLVHKLDQISWLCSPFFYSTFCGCKMCIWKEIVSSASLPSLPKRVWLMMGRAARGSSRNDNNICQRSIRSISNPYLYQDVAFTLPLPPCWAALQAERITTFFNETWKAALLARGRRAEKLLIHYFYYQSQQQWCYSLGLLLIMQMSDSWAAKWFLKIVSSTSKK